MKVVTTKFQAYSPVPWKGRYGRLMGDGAVFHLRHVDGHLWPVLVWHTDDGVAMCRAVRCAATAELVAAVAQAKRHAGGDGGGAFLINEYGKVLVPAGDGIRRFLAGRLKGPLLFENPFHSEKPIDLSDAEHLENGEPWQGPYVGIPYHLHRNDKIYFYSHDERGGRSIYPPLQDYQLIRAIRNVRPYGPVRILVNPAGLVLTKAPSGGRQQQFEDSWQPVFVGSINPNLWFEEE